MWVELAGALTGLGLRAGVDKLLGVGKNKQPDIGKQITELVNKMNNTLETYMREGIQASEDKTWYGYNVVNESIGKNQNILQDYLNKGTEAAKQNIYQGQVDAAGYLQPQLQSGGAGLDAYMDSLGLRRPVVGSYALQDAITKKNTRDTAMSNLGPVIGNPGSAPIAPDYTAVRASVSPDLIKQKISKNLVNTNPFGTGNKYWTWMQPEGSTAGPLLYGNNGVGEFYNRGQEPGFASGNVPIFNREEAVNALYNNPTYYNNAYYDAGSEVVGAAQNNFAAQLGQYNSAKAAYDAYTANVNKVNQDTGLNPMTQAILDAYSQGYMK